MALTFPRDLVFEVYLGRWVEVTALPEGRSLRQVEPVVINRGSNSEQGRALAPPSTMEGVLNNQGGHWTPGNPMSDYWAYLQGRNVPTRLSLRVSRDAFGDVTAGSWGVTDTAESWNHAGVNDSYSTGSGTGRQRVSAVASFAMSFIGDRYRDSEARSKVTFLPLGNVTGGPVEPLNLVQRYQPSGAFAGEHYLLRVEVRTDESVWVKIMHSSLGDLTAFVNTGLFHAAGRSFRGAFYAEGETLRGKVWDAANEEPLGYQVTGHDNRLVDGFPGVRSGIASGNTNSKPIDFEYDDWELRLYRHAGEIQRLEPTWTEGHHHKKASLKSAGVSMRLNRQQTPRLRSAIERYVVTNAVAPAAYWPMDDGKLATEGHVAAGVGNPAVLYDGNFGVGVVRFPFGTGNAGPWLDPVAEIKNSPVARFEPTVPITGWWTSHFAVSHVGGRYSTNANTDGITIGVSGGAVFTITFRSFSYEVDVAGPAGPSVGTANVPNFYDQKLHHLALRAKQNGAAVDWRLWIDGASVLNGSIAATTTPTLSRATYSQNGHAEDSRSRALGHVGLYAGDGPDPAGYSAALFGWVGERALDRAIRICAEEGVPFDYRGDPADTPPMGPQRQQKLLAVLEECAEVPEGFLYEPRSVAGLAIATRRGMSAQLPVATLDYAAGHVAPVLAPSADDRPTANRVTATRPDGGTVVLEQATGPMNTKDPGTDPDAIGVSPARVEVNVEADVQLFNAAGWARALGTVPDVRYPRVVVNLRAPEVTPTLHQQVLALDVGDRLLIENLAAADRYDDLDQLVRGGREVFRDVYGHEIRLNTAPYEKYRSGVYGDAASRYADMGGTTLDAQLTAGTTGARNITTSIGQRWTVDAAAYPLDVMIGGERVTVSGTTGTGAAQVMTISARNVNGLPAAGGKTHPAGTRVELYQPVYYA